MDETRKELLRIAGYSEKSIDLLDRDVNVGAMEHPTVRVRHAGSCNDVLLLYLRVENDVIEDASFEYVGCAGLQASGSGMTELIKGMSAADAERVSVRTIADYLRGLPANRSGSLNIAYNALHEALVNYRRKQAG